MQISTSATCKCFHSLSLLNIKRIRVVSSYTSKFVYFSCWCFNCEWVNSISMLSCNSSNGLSIVEHDTLVDCFGIEFTSSMESSAGRWHISIIIGFNSEYVFVIMDNSKLAKSDITLSFKNAIVIIEMSSIFMDFSSYIWLCWIGAGHEGTGVGVSQTVGVGVGQTDGEGAGAGVDPTTGDGAGWSW